MYILGEIDSETLSYIVRLLMTVGVLIGYVILLMAIWRGMRAHESIALSLKEIASRLKPKAAAETEEREPEAKQEESSETTP